MTSNVEQILDTGNTLLSAVQGMVDMSKNGTNADRANMLVSVAGVVAGILSSEAGHSFTKALLGLTNVNLAAVGAVLNGAQLINAIRAYNAAPANAREAAYQELADKLYGTIAAVGAAVATIPLPQAKTLGLTAWGVATLLQHTFNGNIGKLLDTMGTELWGAFSSVLSSEQGKTWNTNLNGQRALSGSVVGSDWSNPAWQGNDRSIVIVWHEFDAQGRSVSYRSTISVATVAALADVLRGGSTDYHVESPGQRPGESFSGYVDRVNTGLTSMGGGGWQSWNGDIDTGGGGGGGGRGKLQEQSTDDPDYGMRGGFRFAAPAVDAAAESVVPADAERLIQAMASFGAADLAAEATLPSHRTPEAMVLAAA